MKKNPLTQEQLNKVLYRFLRERKRERIPINELYDDSKFFTKKDLYIDIDPIPKPAFFMDPYSRDIPRVYSPDGIPDTEGIKVMQQNSRNLGELLLEDDAINVSGGAAVPGAAFQTRGYQVLFVTIVNPTWATNPTALIAGIHVSTDAFDTEDFTITGRDGVAIQQVCSIADAAYYAFFMPVGSNVGVQTATSIPIFVPIPDIDGMLARLLFTPTGAGVTTEEMTVNVYGVTAR
jgi:hypothetical protein